MNVNRSLIHKFIVTTAFLTIFAVSTYVAHTADIGSATQIISFFLSLATGVILGWFFCYYAWYAIFESDQYTFQEWIKK